MDAVAAIGLANAATFGARALVRPATGLPLAFVFALAVPLPERARAYRAEDAARAPLEALALLVLVDGLQYCVHAATHAARRKAHAVHHRHTRPTPAVAFDTGLEDAVVQLLVPVAVAVHALAPSRAALVAFGVVYSLWLQLIHGTSARLPRALERVLVTPAYHRAHHADPSKNLGHVLVVWDWLAGTAAR
jgi:sterol desaturase/sphingolipid hydroxylase (fatty acid hydroxylase superfamily)